MVDNVLPFPGSGPEGMEPADLDPKEFAEALIEHFGSPQAALEHIGAVGAARRDPFEAALATRPRPTLFERRKKPVTYVVRVELDGIKPPIWRRLRLTSDINLAQLHDILQIAMGWTNSHLHHFQMGPDARDFRMVPFLTDFDLEEGEDDGILERDVHLDQVLGEPGHRLFYEYDFGDSWAHTIKLEQIEPQTADAAETSCVAGRRACPPEDVGGIGGYEEALAALRGETGDDPDWTEQLLDWLPPDYDPEAFDLADVNRALAQGPLNLAQWHPGLVDVLALGGAQFTPASALVARATGERVELTDDEMAAATHRLGHFVTVIGDGVQLTQAGYLPPALVKQLVSDLELLDREWPFAPSREDKTPPVQTLREAATSLGLVRKQHGKLLPTTSGRRLAEQPRKLFEHIRDRLPVGRRDCEQDAGLLALLYAAAGENFQTRLPDAAVIFASLGWRSTASLEQAVWWNSEPTRGVLKHLTAANADPGRIARALVTR